MRTIRLAILFSGNGSNLENIYTKMQGMEINSSLGAPLALGENFGNQQTPSLVLSQNFLQDTKSPPQILELDSNKSDSSKSNESSLRENERSEFSWQSKQNESRDSATESRPIRGAKNRNQTSSSASADFLLESDKRGTPPKSEKATAFWETHLNVVGGSGNRGVQPFLQKEKGESKSKKIANDSQIAKMDSSPTAQNDESFMDCHDSANPESSNDDSIKLDFVLAVSSKNSAFGIQRCANLGLKCEIVDYKQHKENFIPQIIALLEKNQIDLVVLAGFMKILPPAFTAKFRAINIHPSILPLFKGAHAIKESFESDMKIAGVSVHFVSNELDSGALIAQDIIHKIEGESLESFESRIHELEYEIYPRAIIKAIHHCEANLWIRAKQSKQNQSSDS